MNHGQTNTVSVYKFIKELNYKYPISSINPFLLLENVNDKHRKCFVLVSHDHSTLSL